MTVEEKQDLARLLRRYQEDLLELNNKNIELQVKYDKTKGDGYDWIRNGNAILFEMKSGLKAQYEHARLIINKIDVEIGREIKWAM